MPFNVDAARADGISDDEIAQHLKSQYPSFNFDAALKDGISLNEIANHLTQKGGEQTNEQSKPQANMDGNAQRAADQQNQAATEGGPQAINQPADGNRQERFGEINPSDAQAQELQLQVKSDLLNQVAKGGESFEKNAKAESQRAEKRQEDGQAVRSESNARNEAEVSKGGVQPPAQTLVEQLQTKVGQKASMASLIEGGIRAGLGTVAATVAEAALIPEEIATGGIGLIAAPAVGMFAFEGGSELADKVLIKPVESMLGISKDIEEAKQAAPKAAEAGDIASMLPFGIKSLKGFYKAGKEAVEKAGEGQAVKQAAKAVGSRAALGAVGGAAFEPVRYAVEAGEQAAGISDQAPAPITGESLGRSALTGAILGGVGFQTKEEMIAEAAKKQAAKNIAGMDEIASAGLPETAKVAGAVKTDAAIEATEQKKQQPKYVPAKGLEKLSNDRRSQLEEQLKNDGTLEENEADELNFLRSVPSIEDVADRYGFRVRKEREKPVIQSNTEEIDKRIQEAQGVLDNTKDIPSNKRKIDIAKRKLASAIKEKESLQFKPAEAPAEEQPEKPSEAEVKEPEASGVSPVEGVSPVKPAEVKAEEGTAQRVSEGKKEEVKAPRRLEYAKTPDEADAWAKQALTKKAVNPEAIKQRVDAHKAKLESVGKEQGQPKARLSEKVAKNAPQGTRILSAAYRINSGPNKGKIGYGSNHQTAMLDAGIPYSEASKMSAPNMREGVEFGFKTDKDKFVTRDQAEQIARKGGQLKESEFNADKASGYKLHSNHVRMDEYPAELPLWPGAENAAEGQHETDLANGAEIHSKGKMTYEEWKDAFQSKKKSIYSKYSEDRLRNLYMDSEKAQAYSEFFNQPIKDAVRQKSIWEGKTVDQIREASKFARTEDIRTTNEAMNKELEKRGYEPILKDAKKSNPEVWEEAMDRMNYDSQYQPMLVASLRNNIRVLDPVEQAVLVHAVTESMVKRDIALNELINTEISEKEGSPLLAQKQIQAAQAEREFIENVSIQIRSRSAAGSALQFARAIFKGNYSREGVVAKGLGALRKAGKGGELSEKDSSDLLKLADQLKKVTEESETMFDKKKAEKTLEGFSILIDAHRKSEAVISGERMASPKQEVNRYSTLLKNTTDNPLAFGVFIRGMAKNLSELLEGKPTKELANEVHERVQKIIGKGWTMEQTMEALNGYGSFRQESQETFEQSLRNHAKEKESFDRDIAKANAIKNPKERDKAIAKLVNERQIKVDTLESQMKTHFDEVSTDLSELLGELENELLSCE